MGSVNASVHN